MNGHRIIIEDTGESYIHPERKTVLEGMASLGYKYVPLGCRGGGCGICKVKVVAGSYDKRVMSRAHVSEEDEASHRVLACRIWPTSDLRLKVLGKLGKNLCCIQTAAKPADCR